MIKQIRSYLGLLTLVVGLLLILGFVIWITWETVPLLAVLIATWSVLIAIGVRFERQHTRAELLKRRLEAQDGRPSAEYDRRRLEAMALELRRLHPESRTASLILDHKPAYERRVKEDVQ